MGAGRSFSVRSVMKPVVWLAADTLGYPEGAGHLWVYLNWALGLKALGCKVIWLEAFDPRRPEDDSRVLLPRLQRWLEHYGLTDGMALCSRSGGPLPWGAGDGCRDLAEAGEADLLLNLAYNACAEVVGRFRRSALIDIDPGLVQVWLSEGCFSLERHDVYF